MSNHLPVKRAVTVFLLFIFLLNVLGFYGVFLGLRFENAAAVRRTLDENRYSKAEEVTFALPLTVPYHTNQDEAFERVDGEFEHNGEVYRMIKQRLHRDTLYVVCLKDAKGKQLNGAIADFVKTFADKSADAKNQGKAISFIKDYVTLSIGLTPGDTGWSARLNFSPAATLYMNTAGSAIYSPPESRIG